MNSIQMVLVVAPDEELRRSIEFALEAEGFPVQSQSQLSLAQELRGPGTFACIVIDENAIGGWKAGWDQVAQFASPIVLLIDQLQHIPEIDLMTVVTKPLLGRVLVEAVFHAVVQGSPAPTR